MFAAAMGFASCAMMMNAAQKAPPETRSMMMMMAMQQCAQAAQNMEAGKKNKEQADRLAEKNEPPPQAPQVAGQKPEATPQITENQTQPSTDDKQEEESEFPEYKFEPKSNAEIATATPRATESAIDVGLGTAAPTTTVPKLAEQLTFNSDAKKGTEEEAAVKNGAFAFGLSHSNKASLEEQKKAETEREGGARRRKDPGQSSADPVESSSGTGGSESPDTGIDMLSQIFGGAGASGTGGPEVVYLPSSNEKRAINIFQFASRVYTKASTADRRLKTSDSRTASVYPQIAEQ